AWSARYKAWGEAREVIGEAARKAGIENPLRFAGQYFDRETGLHYNRHRYYDPGSGRFISKDPIGLAGGINVYQYAPNPMLWIDPLGLAKRGPKTDGCGPHNEMIAAWGREVQATGGTVMAGGGQLPERVVETVGGFKNGRRPDLIYTDADGNTIYGQVGRVKADGVTPVTREQQAMEDLRTKTKGAGVPADVQFRAYNCCRCPGK
ncbi:RHS repeat-associated core domain-containing protein, partial [Burkholderia stagnalis]